ncbi:hypothetical protein BDA96_06G041000 [Sorghum bicolor]|uniref:MalT-like TPR region domain-containing protein n=2 Tax=Sorghum bicolor TaxID=4558 RepID=A0A921UC12_SORBI|nr:uncharacterized protein LOC8086458 isoform X1 [Sorghum bicolor]KAG0525265.1 hypothetical protein BDA96_06G041000 [Sorghum bicolor]KXG25969.1 hypothetical protein SORBI_3006G038000 [Sorghum bicolor]|eukprot:XP_021319661.1 uncharacterized protein LOC8086458 isoform X1 [Sorghum bicolor]
MAASCLRRLRRIPHLLLQPAAATHCLFPTPAAKAALVTESCPSAEGLLSTLRPGFASNGNFKHQWHHKLDSSVGAVLIGHAVFFLGLSNGSAFAQEDSVSPAAASEHAEGNAPGLQRIEDGSVVSNEHTVKWRIYTDNGREFFQKRQLDEAEKLFQAALLEAKEGFGLRDPHVASALNNLAEFYRLKKEYEKAELLYLEAIEILEESFGSDDIRVGTAVHSLGICYHLQLKLAQAQTCYERALKIEGRVMGIGHPEYAGTMYLLAKVLSLQGKRKNAECLAEESIRILEEAGLGDSPTCIQRMKYLSRELIKSKRFADAEIWQRKILHVLELSKGWDSLDTAIAAELLSLNLEAMDKLKESEELLERCLAVKKKVLPEDHLQVALTLVHLARITLHKVLNDLENANSDVTAYYLAKAKQLSNDSIRIAEGKLNCSRKDQNKINSTSTTDTDKIAATAILLQALNVFGFIDVTAKRLLGQGLVLLLRLPLEHLKHGFFKIDAVHIPGTPRPFIWTGPNIIYVGYSTLQIHFKTKFGKEQDYKSIEDVLRKCISLYKEPHTRRLVKKAVKQDYMMCLRKLIVLVQRIHPFPQMTGLQELLVEAGQIIEELAEESTRNK